MSDSIKESDLQRIGKLADLPWVKVSREQAPNERANRSGEIIYNVRSVEDLRAAARRFAKSS